MARDYYKILKVPSDAPTSRIHVQYRKLILSEHPHKEHDHPHAARTKFFQLGEAYDVLKNPVLRQLYNQLGYDGLTNRCNSIPGYPFGYRYHGNPLRTFEEHFGTIHPYADAYEPRENAQDYFLCEDVFRARTKTKLPPIVIGLEVTLEELFHGNVREVEFMRCISSASGDLVDEQVVKNICIQPGWADGTQILFEREGNQAPNMENSDALVQIIELPHARFFRDDHDLRMRIEVDLLVALCGGDITLTSIDGTPIRIEETNVVKPGSVRMIPGFGMPLEKDGVSRGNLYLDYTVLFPQDMDMTRREMVANALIDRPLKAPVPTTLITVSGYERRRSSLEVTASNPEVRVHEELPELIDIRERGAVFGTFF